MRDIRGPGLALFVVLTFLVAGCTAKDPTGTVKALESVPTDAPSEVGDGDFRLEIHVVSEMENGSAVPNAALLVYPIEKPVSPPSIGELQRRNASYVARANADGVVVANLIGGRTYSFQATGDGFTEEFRHLRKMDRHLPNPFYFILFKSNVTVEMTGVLKTTAKKLEKFPELAPSGISICGNSCNGPAATWLENVTFHPIPEYKYNKEYVARLHEVKLTLTWENRQDSYGDLGVRAGFVGTDHVWEADDQTELLGPGRETFTVQHKYLEPPTIRKNPRFVAGPITRMPIVAQGGLPWKIVVEATFSTESDNTCVKPYAYYYGECYNERRVYEPGFELAFATLAIAGGAWLLRRRGL
ncbi:MAG: hypothetical protein HYT80_06755 [Euryarchaeota archaeon]|nr:hypothetical protein [Euryarchaeota archaeon]